MKEIFSTFTYQADLIITFAMFYMIIFSNTIKNLLACHQMNFLENNKYIVLLTSFILFYFLCSLVSNTGHLKYVPPIQKLLYTIGYFFLLLITTRLDFKITFAVLGLIFLIYFIELNKNFYSTAKDPDLNSSKNEYMSHWITLDYPFKIRLFPFNKKHIELIETLEWALYILMYVLIVLGLISYGGEIKDTLNNKKNITWVDVLFSNKLCNIKDRRPFMHYLKLGIGLKI
jgi:hypothetical protein